MVPVCPRKAGALHLKIYFTWYTFIDDKIITLSQWLLNQLLSLISVHDWVCARCSRASRCCAAPSSRLQQEEHAVIRVVGIPNDSPGLVKGGEGRHRTSRGIVSDVSPEKRSICVSSSVALAGLSDTITEEPVSCDSAGETPRGLAG